MAFTILIVKSDGKIIDSKVPSRVIRQRQLYGDQYGNFG
jgi:hypothetical protein